MGSCISQVEVNDPPVKVVDLTVGDDSTKKDISNNNSLNSVVDGDNTNKSFFGISSRNVSQQDNNRNKFVLYSDFTCPYCYLEFIRLTRAMKMLPEEERLDICHGPFQLDDTLPIEGVDKYKFLSTIIPPSALDPMIQILCEQFEELDMEMNPRGLLGNSAPAHRLQIWAESNIPREQAIKLKDQLFRIHSCQGKSMGDVDAILKAAAKAGLKDEAMIRSILDDKKNERKLKKAKKHAKETLGIQTVPYLLYIDGKGKQRKLEEATAIETVDGFADLIDICCRKS